MRRLDLGQLAVAERLGLEERLAERQLGGKERAARDRLLSFCEYTFPNYQRAAHLELAAAELEAIERGDNDALIIEMPPRHGKTQLVSVRFPAWAMCRRPDRRFIAASYGERLAGAIGRVVRNIVNTQPLFPRVRLAPDMKAKDQWETVQGGHFLAVGIGSGVIGFGGDIITIDDPFKKREEAESQVQRDKVWDWWTSEIITREERGSAKVIVMHRWHEDDLVGRLLQEEGDQAEGGAWKVLRLPAIAEENDQLGRKLGEALWPWRRTAEELEVLQQRVGPRNWNSLFQQRPAPDEGFIFKWWPRYDKEPAKFSEIVIGLDTAFTDNEESDYSAYTAWGRANGRVYWLDCGRYRGETPEAERQMMAFYWSIGGRYPGTPVKVLHRRKVAIDKVFAQHLRAGQKTIGGRAGLPVVEVPLPAGNTKQEMATLASVEFEAARALCPATPPMSFETWQIEHKGFPTALHDDFVETTNIVMRYCFKRPERQVQTEAVRVYARARRR